MAAISLVLSVKLLIIIAFLPPPRVDAFSDLESSGNGPAGIGSGDLTKDLCYHPACDLYRCPSLSIISETRAIAKSLCHATCIDWIISSANDSSLQQHVNVTSMRSNCTSYNQLYMCTEGCVLMAANDVSSVEACSSTCFTNCESDGQHLPYSSCHRQCNIAECTRGCQIHHEIYQHANNGGGAPSTIADVQVNPYQSPYLHSPGVYQVYVGDGGKWDGTILLSFIVEVCQSDNDQRKYYWLMALDDALILDPGMICQLVTVRVAAVNRYGMSQYSNPVTLSVYGDKYPKFPDHPPLYSIVTSIYNDDRPYHWNNAIVNISWHLPNNFEFGLDGYTLSILSPLIECGTNQNIAIDKDVLHYSWMSLNGSISPMNNCTYYIRIYSNPHSSAFPGTPDPVPVHITATTASSHNFTYNVTANVITSLLADEGARNIFRYDVSIQLPADPYLTRGIIGFNIYLWDDGGNLIDVHHNTSIYTSFTGIPSANGHYTIEIETLYRDYIDERYVRYNTSILIDARPLPPSVVTGVILNRRTFHIEQKKFHITLEMTWDGPRYTDVKSYIQFIVCINVMVLSPSDPIPSHPSYLFNTTSLPPKSDFQYLLGLYPWRYYMSIEEANATFLPPITNDTGLTLYIQVSSINTLTGRISNWSDPIEYRVSFISPHIPSVVPSSVVPSVVPSVSPIPAGDKYLYSEYAIVPIVVMIAVVAAIILIPFGAYYIYKRYRHK
jgi:hypothetical protein